MTSSAKTAITLDVSGIVDGTTANAADVTTPLAQTLAQLRAGQVGVSAGDTHVKHLENAISAGSGVTISKLAAGGDESLQISATPGVGVIYVAKSGSDANDGLSIGAAKLTIGAAITAAAGAETNGTGAAPSASNRIIVRVVDAGVYSESITTSSNVDLFGPNATIAGSVELVDGVTVRLREVTVSGNNQKGVFKTSGNSSSYAYVDRINVSGSNSFGATNQSSGSVLFIQAAQIWIGADGVGIGDTAQGTGHTHFLVADLYLNGNNAIGIAANTNNSSIIGYVDHILEVGSFTNTRGLLVGSNGIIEITASEIRADVAYDVASGGLLYLTCPHVQGTRTGTPTVEISDQLRGVAIASALTHTGSTAGFFGATPISRPTITGSRGGNVALANLLTALASLGLVVDGTTA